MLSCAIYNNLIQLSIWLLRKLQNDNGDKTLLFHSLFCNNALRWLSSTSLSFILFHQSSLITHSLIFSSIFLNHHVKKELNKSGFSIQQDSLLGKRINLAYIPLLTALIAICYMAKDYFFSLQSAEGMHERRKCMEQNST